MRSTEKSNFRLKHVQINKCSNKNSISQCDIMNAMVMFPCRRCCYKVFKDTMFGPHIYKHLHLFAETWCKAGRNIAKTWQAKRNKAKLGNEHLKSIGLFCLARLRCGCTICAVCAHEFYFELSTTVATLLVPIPRTLSFSTLKRVCK